MQNPKTAELRNAVAPAVLSAERSENVAGLKPLAYSGEPAKDREIWIVTEEDGVQQVQFDNTTRWYTGDEVWARTDGESGSWKASDIIGWADDYEAVRMFDQ